MDYKCYRIKDTYNFDYLSYMLKCIYLSILIKRAIINSKSYSQSDIAHFITTLSSNDNLTYELEYVDKSNVKTSKVLRTELKYYKTKEMYYFKEWAYYDMNLFTPQIKVIDI